MKRISAIACVLLIAACRPDPLLQAIVPPGEEPTTSIGFGTVTGRVVDRQSNKGLELVQVRVPNVTPPVSVLTDSSGNFVLQRVPQGKQFVAATKEGYTFAGEGPGAIADVLPNATIKIRGILMTPVSSSPTPEASLKEH